MKWWENCHQEQALDRARKNNMIYDDSCAIRFHNDKSTRSLLLTDGLRMIQLNMDHILTGLELEIRKVLAAKIGNFN